MSIRHFQEKEIYPMNQEKKKYLPLPQPDEIPTREKEDAMGAYFMMFASLAAGLPLPVVNLIAAIIYYSLNRKKSLFVQFHSMQSVLSQIPVSLLNSAGVIWAAMIFLFDYPLTDTFKGYVIAVLAVNIVYFIFSIIAAVKSRKGKLYYFIFFGRYCYDKVFREKDDQTVEDSVVNVPPKM